MGRILTWIGLIFSGVGTVLLIFCGWLLYEDFALEHTYARAEGTVVQLARQVSRDDGSTSSSTTYAAVVAFVDGAGRAQEMTETLSSNPPRFSRGERVPVLYDPAHPSDAVVDDFWGRKGGIAIMLVVALPITVVGAVLLIVDVRRHRRRRRLLQHGRPIQADFLHCFRDEGTSRNGEHPYRVVAQARDPATGRLRRYQSDPVWVDPSESLQGRPVRVLVDPADARSYHVDLSAVVDAER